MVAAGLIFSTLALRSSALQLTPSSLSLDVAPEQGESVWVLQTGSVITLGSMSLNEQGHNTWTTESFCVVQGAGKWPECYSDDSTSMHGSWGKYIVNANDDGTFSLQSGNSKQWCSYGGSSGVQCNSPTIGSFEKFTFEDSSYTPQYQPGGGVYMSGGSPGQSETACYQAGNNGRITCNQIKSNTYLQIFYIRCLEKCATQAPTPPTLSPTRAPPTPVPTKTPTPAPTKTPTPAPTYPQVYGVNMEDEIFARPFNDNGESNWQQVLGGLKYVSVGETSVWGVNSGGNIYRCELPCQGTWDQVPGALTQLDVGDTEVWGVNQQQEIWWTYSDDTSGAWTQVLGASLVDVSVGKDYIWGVTSNQEIYKCERPCLGSWTQVGGQLVQLDVGVSAVWGVNSHSEIYTMPADGSGNWVQIGGDYPLFDVSVGTDYIWGLHFKPGVTGNTLVQCAMPCSTGSWYPAYTGVPGGLTQIDASWSR